jgi:hypothetical protein
MILWVSVPFANLEDGESPVLVPTQKEVGSKDERLYWPSKLDDPKRWPLSHKETIRNPGLASGQENGRTPEGGRQPFVRAGVVPAERGIAPPLCEL